MLNLRDDHLQSVGHLHPVYPIVSLKSRVCTIPDSDRRLSISKTPFELSHENFDGVTANFSIVKLIARPMSKIKLNSIFTDRNTAITFFFPNIIILHNTICKVLIKMNEKKNEHNSIAFHCIIYILSHMNKKKYSHV
jgi:hypothetical protein